MNERYLYATISLSALDHITKYTCACNLLPLIAHVDQNGSSPNILMGFATH